MCDSLLPDLPHSPLVAQAAAALRDAGFAAVTAHGAGEDPAAAAGSQSVAPLPEYLVGWGVDWSGALIPGIVVVVANGSVPGGRELVLLDEARDLFGTRRHAVVDSQGGWWVAGSGLTECAATPAPPRWGGWWVPGQLRSTTLARHALADRAAVAYRRAWEASRSAPRARAAAAAAMAQDPDAAFGVVAGTLPVGEKTLNRAIAAALEDAQEACAADPSDGSAPEGVGDAARDSGGAQVQARTPAQVPVGLPAQAPVPASATARPAWGGEDAVLPAPQWGAPAVPLVQLVRRFDHPLDATGGEYPSMLTNLRPTSSVRAGDDVILPGEVEPGTGRIVSQRDSYAGPAYLVVAPSAPTSSSTPAAAAGAASPPAPARGPGVAPGDLMVAGGPRPVAHLVTTADAGRKFSRHFLCLRGPQVILQRVWAWVNSPRGSHLVAGATAPHPQGSVAQHAALLQAIAIPPALEELPADQLLRGSAEERLAQGAHGAHSGHGLPGADAWARWEELLWPTH
ncbi:hypothetical protein C1Y63_05465 [Corynebacterium sp. 13CS0277]|uniref:hypothetical protein n=1 Tax=Corynebacterium sp. 13CS0277 TaxID=2071994 RepID=UPI000D0342C0|nr:hypothetical protein [Corynebacterium sp. 13CS0277]PRQ11626.1 hypothetical protein C1Y63_05465 [Corynebacterium sp. 13CS0277]